MREIDWTNGRAVVRDLPPPIVTRLQARLALGPDTCAALDAMADDPDTPWAMRQTLAYAQQWQRTHPSMDEIGWALGYDADQIDALFQMAATL